MALASDWPSPSFSGAFLPVERKIDQHGFTAAWKVPHLARSVPQAWTEGEAEFNLGRLGGTLFGVDLFVPVDFYDLVTRALKYGLMFPTVGFMAVFIMETLVRKRLHPVQYLFTGAALVLFFVLLLSFAEHIGFLRPMSLAASATSLLVAAYVWRAMGSIARGGTMLAVLLILYALLYFILKLEDYALLAGALAGFAMLAAAMFLTLGVDWSGGGKLCRTSTQRNRIDHGATHAAGQFQDRQGQDLERTGLWHRCQAAAHLSLEPRGRRKPARRHLSHRPARLRADGP